MNVSERTCSRCDCPRGVLIAGCGYLGTRLAQLWLREGVSVSAITRHAHRAESLAAAGISPVLLDLSRPEAAGAVPADSLVLPAVDVVVWSVGFDRSAGVSREAIWIDGLARLTELLSTTPSPRRLIYVSSTGVYGDAGGEEVDETHPPQPVTESGECCWRAEQHLRQRMSLRHPNTDVTVLRMAGIYGPDRLLRRITDLRNGAPVTSPPDEWLNLIHVDDAAALVNAASLCLPLPAVTNVVNSGTLTRREYYSRLADLTQSPPPVFAAASPSEGAAELSGRRSGNKRVVSRHRRDFPVDFRFDDVADGLADAVRRTMLLRNASVDDGVSLRNSTNKAAFRDNRY